MTNILKLISKSWVRTPRTLRFPDRHAPAARYRGAIHMDTSKCLACGICDIVCVSGAISVTAFDDHFIWDYDPGRCTFCGRCVDHCPGDALTQDADRPPAYERAGDLREVNTVMYPLCPRCGHPAQPLNERMLTAAFAEVSARVRDRARLCDRCRLAETQKDMKKSFSAALPRTEKDESARSEHAS